MDGYRYRAVFTTDLDTATSSSARLTVNVLSWNSFALQNSWVDYASGYQTNGYRKTTSGIVQLKGLIKRSTGSPSVGETIGILPVGYRPSVPLLFLASTSSNTYGRIDVYPDGSVVFVAGSGSWISMDNMRTIFL